MGKAEKLKKAVAYVVLSLLVFLCLFFFYCLVINATRSHPEIQKDFHLFPENPLVPIFITYLTIRISQLFRES